MAVGDIGVVAVGRVDGSVGVGSPALVLHADAMPSSKEMVNNANLAVRGYRVFMPASISLGTFESNRKT